jgi:hypothetical protein
LITQRGVIIVLTRTAKLALKENSKTKH